MVPGQGIERLVFVMVGLIGMQAHRAVRPFSQMCPPGDVLIDTDTDTSQCGGARRGFGNLQRQSSEIVWVKHEAM